MKEFKKDRTIKEFDSVADYLRGWKVAEQSEKKTDFYTLPQEYIQEMLEMFGDPTPDHAHPTDKK